MSIATIKTDYSRPITGRDIGGVRRRVNRLQAEYARARSLQDSLVPLEQGADVERQVNKIKDDLDHATAELHTILRYQGRFPRVDLEPLTWRNGQGAPRFVLFNPNNPTFTFKTELHTGYNGEVTKILSTIRPELPNVLWAKYQDFAKYLESQAVSRKKTLSVTARFGGILPLEAREKLAITKVYFPQTFILAEVTTWSTTEESPIDDDPLIVGYDGGALWLTYAFDTTSAEEYVKREFTT